MKITIDVSEDELKEDFTLDNCLTPAGMAVYSKLRNAYEAEKNKIQLCDWHYKGGRTIWKALDEIEVRDANQNKHKRLSQPLQDLLNKEMAK